MRYDTVQALDGRFTADGFLSVFGFSVTYDFEGVKTFHGTLDDVDATLTAGPGGLSLEGSAKVESISIREPAEMRAHVLGADFFDVENHPEITFRSTGVDLDDDGAARVAGELTIAGTTRAVGAEGSWRRPDEGPDSLARLAIDLEASIDRRDFGFDWQMHLPDGGLALAWDVAIGVHLELVRQDD